MKAPEIAARAAELVGGDRDRQHGAKHDNFSRIAHVWNGWMRARFGANAPQFRPDDIGAMMAMMKLARTLSGAHNIDDWIDACGYAACSGEIAEGAQ